MGNTSGKREGKDSGGPMSPTKENPNAFDFHGKGGILQQASMDDSLDLPPGTLKEMLNRQGEIPDQRMRVKMMESPGMESKHTPVVFKWEGGGKNVFISGSFNHWASKIPLNKSQGDFTTILDLPEGEYQYKYFVDGQWQHNPKQPTKNNEFGATNNVLSVNKTDFEVFEALAIDSSTSGTKHRNLSGSPPGKYAQEIPTREMQTSSGGPPFLPPHLLNVLLNKDVGAQYEPTLLPEPNHVMLNHLYALSIKDGVMVLSATHRYRKKYVTTLLYKPI
ncbi:5'-AMP-activated protein kinase subunit beta-2-like [Patiria miniata]|uniref:5'-AMP-activated protein kinase subunit beta-1 n=1 Tax=Patiria miniata TaxID=46514 RepID=A0A914BB30_PATMI|nr:5'-AMP-activated protein kinase subunit beta-2-like [Patiria miniata]XP_038073266.1 5'-AMP-activated protein kinase subunit beta-2-like [Patiria miniata]XP_038073267.1 5'-AMP-activated protein kinase subunit beta-2-like [Patiria miniata]